MQPIQPNNPLLSQSSPAAPRKNPKRLVQTQRKRRRHLWSNSPCPNFWRKKIPARIFHPKTWTKRRGLPLSRPWYRGRGKKKPSLPSATKQVRKNTTRTRSPFPTPLLICWSKTTWTLLLANLSLQGFYRKTNQWMELVWRISRRSSF